MILLAALALPVRAQSFNIDFGDAVSLPSTSYAAVGLPGLWNPADFQITAPSFLTDVSGGFTGVWIYSEHGPRDSFRIPDPLTSGNDEALIDDGLGGTGDVLIPVTVLHLAPGRYRVIAYGLTGAAPNQRTYLEVGNPMTTRRVAATVGGAWTGTYAEGVSHASFGLNVPDGRIDLYVAGGIWGQSGFCNAMQIVKHCDADFSTTAIAGTPGFGVPNGLLNNDDFFYFLGRFAENDPGEADLTASAVPGSPGFGLPNGVVNNDDFFYYLALFAAGC